MYAGIVKCKLMYDPIFDDLVICCVVGKITLHTICAQQIDLIICEN